MPGLEFHLQWSKSWVFDCDLHILGRAWLLYVAENLFAAGFIMIRVFFEMDDDYVHDGLGCVNLVLIICY
jgi:hypothetical protein